MGRGLQKRGIAKAPVHARQGAGQAGQLGSSRRDESARCRAALPGRACRLDSLVDWTARWLIFNNPGSMPALLRGTRHLALGSPPRLPAHTAAGSGYGFGAGVRIDTPIGPLRLEYAMNDRRQTRFHLGIGSNG